LSPVVALRVRTFHVPTNCSFVVCRAFVCWAPEVAGSRASPNAAISEKLMLRRFMVFLLWWSLNTIRVLSEVSMFDVLNVETCAVQSFWR
jgi:hypothetical protein